MLGASDHVRADIVGVTSPHIAGSAKSTDHLVGHQQYVVLVQHHLYFLEIGGRRQDYAASPHDWLGNKCGYGFRPFLQYELFQTVGESSGEGLLAFVCFAKAVEIGRIGLLHSIKRKVKIILHQGDRCQAATSNRDAMVSAKSRNNFLFIPKAATVVVVPGKLDRCIDGF